MSMIMLPLCGCSIFANKLNQSSESLNSSQSSSTFEGCPTKPEVALDTQNVKAKLPN